MRTWVESLQRGDTSINVGNFCKFLKLLLAILYCFSPQGRPNAFVMISYEGFMSSFDNGVNPFSKFLKTSLRLHYQVLAIVDGPPSEFIRYYINIVRPMLYMHLGKFTEGKFNCNFIYYSGSSSGYSSSSSCCCCCLCGVVYVELFLTIVFCN